MKKTILLISILLLAFTGNGQTFKNDISAYEADSVFAVMADSTTGHSYCDIEPLLVTGDDSPCVKVTYSVVNDYGRQPCADTSTHGWTYSAAVFVTIYGSGVTHDVSFSLNNINANTYTAWKMYGEKFIYWKIADKYRLTITN